MPIGEYVIVFKTMKRASAINDESIDSLIPQVIHRDSKVIITSNKGRQQTRKSLPKCTLNHLQQQWIKYVHCLVKK